MKKNKIKLNNINLICSFSILCIIGLLASHFYLDKTPGYRWNIFTANATSFITLLSLNEQNIGTLEEHEVFEVLFDHFENINEVVVKTADGHYKNIILAGIKNKMPNNISIDTLNSLYKQGDIMYLVISDSKITKEGKYIGYIFDDYPERLSKDANDSINAFLFYKFGAKKANTSDNILEIFFKKW